MMDRALIPLNQRLGIDAREGLGAQLETQLLWAREIQALEPRSPHRKRLYSLLGDSALNIDWLGFERDYDLAREVLSELKNPTDNSLDEVPRVFVELACSSTLSHDIDYWLQNERFADRRCGLFSRDPFYGPALTTSEFRSAFEKGQRLALEEAHRGALWTAVELVNPSGFIGAAALLYLHFGLRPERVLRSFLPENKAAELALKIDRTLKRHPYSRDPLTSMTFFGNFEMAFACGLVTASAVEGRFALLGGIGGWAVASMSELILPGSLHYCSSVQRAPSDWIDDAPAAFIAPAVFASSSAESAPLQFQLALLHLLSVV